MESVLNFISVNYIWLLIILVIILLAILGYIAEQNGFAENFNKKEKKIKTKNDNSNVEKNSEVDEIKNDNGIEETTNIEESIINEELNPIDESVELDKEFEEKIGENNETLNIDQDFNQVLKDVEETTNKANIEINDDVSVDIDEEDIWKF